jgi:hypothetical protein
MNRVNLWNVKKAWVSCYCLPTDQNVKGYHPNPSDSPAQACGVSTHCFNWGEDGKCFEFKLELHDGSIPHYYWNSDTRDIICKAVFRPNCHGDIMSSEVIKVDEVLNGNPFGPYTHVQFHITVAVDATSQKRVFTTTTRWFNENKGDKENLTEVTTSYPWKEP